MALFGKITLLNHVIPNYTEEQGSTIIPAPFYPHMPATIPQHDQ